MVCILSGGLEVAAKKNTVQEIGTLFAPPEDFDKMLADAYQKGRREGIGEAVKAVRIAIDARFNLEPGEFDIGELPTGLDIGELLVALNRFLNEFGKRCYHDGIEFLKTNPEGKSK